MRADWRDDIGTFRVGIVAEPGAGNTVPGLALLTEAYTKALGMKVEFVVSRDYAALIEAQANAHIEYAVYSTTATPSHPNVANASSLLWRLSIPTA
ncbi:hypothetical protein [Mesorhizobium sp.]|uniref:hypothetical protein n=1 Tax=Mesorhizobium sp. TaxID=1871066 RepID=UPI00269BC989